MSSNLKHTKLTLSLLRMQGKKVANVQWTTNSTTNIIGAGHPLFAQFSDQEIHVGDKHIELTYENNHWYVKNTHTKLGSSLDGQQLLRNTRYRLLHNSIIEIGLCQIQVSDHQYLSDTDDLKTLLQIDNLASTGLTQESIELSDNQSGAVHQIGQVHLEEKTTFEDLGLGTHFDEQAFFREVQSESSRLSTLKTGASHKSAENLDILDQLAIESELAILNPSLLSKNTDYWHGQTKQTYVNNQPIPELAHLFAIDDYSQERMLPLDNLAHINKLLSSNPKIDQIIPGLNEVTDYALFDGEKGVEPLRLFSIQHQDLHAYIPQVTPEFTQKEHHASSMDGHFSVPNTDRKQQKTSSNYRNPTDHANSQNDDWLNTFSASLADKISSDEILNALSKEPPKPTIAAAAQNEDAIKSTVNTISQTMSNSAQMLKTKA